MSAVAFETSQDNINEFVANIAREYLLDNPYHKKSNDRRAETRINVTLPVVLTPLDEEFQPADYEIHAVTRDISGRGVGVVCNSPVTQRLVSLSFQQPLGDQIRVIGKVVHCNEVGYYFHLGCNFVTS